MTATAYEPEALKALCDCLNAEVRQEHLETGLPGRDLAQQIADRYGWDVVRAQDAYHLYALPTGERVLCEFDVSVIGDNLEPGGAAFSPLTAEQSARLPETLEAGQALKAFDEEIDAWIADAGLPE